MNTTDTPANDVFVLVRPELQRENNRVMKAIKWRDFTAEEVAALAALLRPIYNAVTPPTANLYSRQQCSKWCDLTRSPAVKLESPLKAAPRPANSGRGVWL